MASSGRRTGSADLPLHGGKAPHWLFRRMVALTRELVRIMVAEGGPEELLRRLSDPRWFQALGCAAGFDWHSSGLTTTLCGALKEGLRGLEGEVGLQVCGGKGAAARRTPEEIRAVAERCALEGGSLVEASRLSAKVDSNALQDGYRIYHHSFFVTARGRWAVVQQGMHEGGWARRYHWLGEEVSDFVRDPQAAVCGRPGPALNLVAGEGEANREGSVALCREPPARLVGELARAREFILPGRHRILAEDLDPRRLERILLKTYERPPADYASLVGMAGVGAKTLRALSLLADLLYGAPPSFRDPARFSFAHGGKDGHPFPVDRTTYDQSIEFLRRAVSRARLDRTERLQALRRLHTYYDVEA
ncbi:MAG: DUF763 domain-containing protein [Thermaerobacter sp.]|nr:DUF763 domain-containing protein [Thermaerobacter sp.]